MKIKSNASINLIQGCVLEWGHSPETTLFYFAEEEKYDLTLFEQIAHTNATVYLLNKSFAVKWELESYPVQPNNVFTSQHLHSKVDPINNENENTTLNCIYYGLWPEFLKI